MENIVEIWGKVLERVKDDIPETTYNAWVLPLVPHDFDGSCFSVITGYRLAITVIKNKHDVLFTSALSEIIGKNVSFSVLYDDKLNKKLEIENKKAKKEEFIKNLEERLAPQKYDNLKQMHSSCRLNLKYKFENFVAGAENKFAYAASVAVAKNPGTKYNPLFIYGGSGLGKTHLLQSIGHDILLNKPELKVKYIKTEEFINDLVNSLSKGMDKGCDKNAKMNEFRNKYRKVDVLLIDDIQLIEGKQRTEEEIFNTFETLHQLGKQIVLTSDRPPEKFNNSPDRLKTRFQMGLLADVQIPDIETRMAILQKLADTNNVNMPYDVIEFLAGVYNKNIRELEGAFNNVSAFSTINEVPLTVENVKKIIKYSDKKKNITIDGIIDNVAEYYNISVDDIKSSTRVAKVAFARQVIVYLAKELTSESYPSIGDALNRKHTTIMYSYDKIKDDMKSDMKLAADISSITNKINM